jgi:predicted hydrocarbon binding protein
MSSDRSDPVLAIPRSALALLSHRCAGLGADGMRALREAGYRAGVSLVRTLGDDPGGLSVPEFWERLAETFEESGLGSVRFEPVSAVIGAVAWRSSPETSGTRSERSGAQCHFAAGVLGGVLSRTAGKTVDVLEIRCGAGGDRPCWFLFGAVPNMRSVHAAARGAVAATTAGRTETSGARS